ncbi:MAG: hypothetical protein KatS3mg131_1084 [Candidatus Tectimicrobiota bacterium]|nr:MAG: hypothetical protein KatS3mg131_1084 [Candidatus Tectomicrobia bacterium]
MSAGIRAFGAYVPWLRLSRQAIATYWGGRAAPGEKAMANYDEDTITMGVAAAPRRLGNAAARAHRRPLLCHHHPRPTRKSRRRR